MTDTTASTSTQQPVSLETMLHAMREIDLLPKNTEWMLVSPDGRMWKGEPTELLKVLMPHHPLLKGITP